jgi:hypothetical protein
MSNNGFLSKRVKLRNQSGITTDRYEFLGLDQAEPNLGDPTVGLSSVGAKPYTGNISDLYVLVADGTGAGNRYWTNQGNIISGGIVSPGSITVRRDGAILGSANQITDLNFVGNGASITSPASWIGAGSSSIDIRIVVGVSSAVGNYKNIQYKGNDGFLDSSDSFIYDPITQRVGINSTDPTVELDLIGNANISETLNVKNTINSGVSTTGSLSIGSTQVISNTLELQNISSIDETTRLTLETALEIEPNNFNSLNVSGISTLQIVESTIANISGILTSISIDSSNINVSGIITSGNINTQSIDIGFSTSTNNWVSGVSTISTAFVETLYVNRTEATNIGIGTTNPQSELDVNGDIRFNGLLYTSNGSGLSGEALISDGINPPYWGSVSAVNAGSATSVSVSTNNDDQYYYPTFVDTTNGIDNIKVDGGSLVYNPFLGNLGIGSTQPSSTLDVGGNTNISGIVNSYGFISGIGTFTSIDTDNLFLSENLNVLGISTVNNLNVLGISTVNNLNVNGNAVVSNNLNVLGISTFNDVKVSNINVTSGIITATTFNGNVTGNVIGNITGNVVGNINSSGISTFNEIEVNYINITSGIITATTFSTGTSGNAINITTNTISGPSEIIIDPSTVGDNTGSLRIKGDLYVDGTTTTINSTSVEILDSQIGVASSISLNSVLDGAGIGIGSTSIRKTLIWNNSSSSLKSSENFDLLSGKSYKIDGVDVITSTSLGSNISTSYLTSVGTLNNLSVSGVTTSTGGFSGNLTGEVTGTSFASSPSGINVSGITTTILLDVGVGGTVVKTTSSGFVGINSTSPKSELDIIGNANVSGVITATKFVGNVEVPSVNATNFESQTVYVTGVTTSLGGFVGSGVSVSGIVTASSYNISNVGNISTNSLSINTISPTSIESFSATIYRSAKIQVQISQGSDYQSSDLLLVHNGSVSNIIEYGSIATNGYLCTFSSDINGGNARLLVTMTSGLPGTIKVISQKITV